jgi:hypothetical protein
MLIIIEEWDAMQPVGHGHGWDGWMDGPTLMEKRKRTS